jgi:hydrogenase expression/formation protein HypE
MSILTAPTVEQERIVLAHGGGGQLTARLLAEHVLPHVGNRLLDPLTDGAVIGRAAGRLVFTTDAFVVQPLEFPGGDIGRLAVCGTVNDLAVMGAVPRALSLALIIEEGLTVATLERVMASVARAAGEAGVPIATGDTKVIERRRGDGLMIATAGVGELPDGVDWCVDRVRAGDRVLITGRLAEHGLTIMTVREGMRIDSELASDAAPLNGLIGAMRATGAAIRFMRDPTRGGVAGVLCDIVERSGLGVHVYERALPISAVARHTAELLGLDPLTVANEGKGIVVVAAEHAERVLEACHAHALGREAALIGEVVEAFPPLVELHTAIGGARIVQRPYGEELPRIC